MKACFPVAQHIAELYLHHARQILTHQVAQITLPRHEADQRDWPVRIGGLHQLDQLGALAADEVDICRMAGQPQHQFVQEQDDRVVTQIARMAAHDAHAVIQRHERLAAARQCAIGREELADQITHQARALLAVGCLQHGRLEARGVPTGVERAPATRTSAVALRAFIQLGKERLISHAQPQLAGVLEQPLGQVEARHRCCRVLLAHELGVLAQHGAFHVASAHHVVGHQQELAAMRPAVARHHVGQFRRRAGLGIAGQQQVQHGHEVALARAETPVQIGGLAAAGLHGLLDKAQRIAEGIHQLWRDHIVAQSLLGMGDAFGQLEHEIALVHPLRNVDQVFQQRHG